MKVRGSKRDLKALQRWHRRKDPPKRPSRTETERPKNDYCCGNGNPGIVHRVDCLMQHGQGPVSNMGACYSKATGRRVM